MPCRLQLCLLLVHNSGIYYCSIIIIYHYYYYDESIKKKFINNNSYYTILYIIIYPYYYVLFIFYYAPTTSRAATDMANNEPIIHPPKHKQTKTRTAETDHKQPPSTATFRLLLPEERQPRAIKTRARPLQPGAPETQVHSPNQGYLHPHPHPVSHRRQRPAPLG